MQLALAAGHSSSQVAATSQALGASMPRNALVTPRSRESFFAHALAAMRHAVALRAGVMTVTSQAWLCSVRCHPKRSVVAWDTLLTVDAGGVALTVDADASSAHLPFGVDTQAALLYLGVVSALNRVSVALTLLAPVLSIDSARPVWALVE